MGHLQAEEYKTFLGKELGLKTHLKHNFYPPLPGYTQNIIIREFKKYWKKKFEAYILLQNINKKLGSFEGDPTKPIVGLNTLTHFIEFLNEGDLQ